MLKIKIDADLAYGSLEEAAGVLYDETGLDPVAVMVNPRGLYTAEKLRQSILFENLEIIIAQNFPSDMWVLYNHKDAIYSNGA